MVALHFLMVYDSSLLLIELVSAYYSTTEAELEGSLRSLAPPCMRQENPVPHRLPLCLNQYDHSTHIQLLINKHCTL